MPFRQLISLIMLMLIISHGVFQLFIFKIFQVKYRQEMLEVIEDGILENELKRFTFSRDDLKTGTTKIQWIEEDEFRIDDEMYDVVRTKAKEDSVYLYCLHDENESRLYTILDEYLQQLMEDDPDKANELNSINNFLSQFYSEPIEAENNALLIINKNYFAELNSNLLEGEHSLVIPPPRS